MHRATAKCSHAQALCGADIFEQTAQAPDEAAANCIDCIRFLSAVIPGQRTLSLGQLGDCYGWILWGISRTHDPAERVNHAQYALPPYEGAPDALNEAVLPSLLTGFTPPTRSLANSAASTITAVTSSTFRRIVLTALAKGQKRPIPAVQVAFAISQKLPVRSAPRHVQMGVDSGLSAFLNGRQEADIGTLSAELELLRSSIIALNLGKSLFRVVVVPTNRYF